MQKTKPSLLWLSGVHCLCCCAYEMRPCWMYEGVCRQHVRRNESVIMYMYGTSRTLHAVTSYSVCGEEFAARTAASSCANLCGQQSCDLQRIANRGGRTGNCLSPSRDDKIPGFQDLKNSISEGCLVSSSWNHCGRR
ncbi:hypothetical protein J3E69DRAFT_161177 [Trichoderma sp. SZMC 28015]